MNALWFPSNSPPLCHPHKFIISSCSHLISCFNSKREMFLLLASMCSAVHPLGMTIIMNWENGMTWQVKWLTVKYLLTTFRANPSRGSIPSNPTSKWLLNTIWTSVMGTLLHSTMLITLHVNTNTNRPINNRGDILLSMATTPLFRCHLGWIIMESTNENRNDNNNN